ncbi:hypothetical protein [Enterovirga rhinocerotis]|uniref:PXPV repeat-containing protein n=1 Tax=Enterovirga rhinocerotis TaxID=1339210 RepID=A0A4R7C966_9HYPH|nr:hypothetical protein [Enterovirga rhinocerotis]TDR94951.1 hypothetical protein EV668_2243 [Enterovirga rhinocerotis]
MRFVVISGLAACLVLAAAIPAVAADLREPPIGAYGYPQPSRYGQIWDEQDYGPARRHPRRPPTRVMGGPGYVGSDYGLGKPAFSGVGPRPDWGRSSID